MELATSRVIGAEALVRWWRGGEAVSPREFLAVAEDSGLIVPLGDWVLREACAQGAAWRGAWDIGVSVNFARQSTRPVLRPVAAALAETGLPPGALTARGHRAGAGRGRRADRRPPGQLRGLGVRLAIDDFGTGYASLAYLRQLRSTSSRSTPPSSPASASMALALLTRTIVQVGHDLASRSWRRASSRRVSSRAAGNGLRVRAGLPGRAADGGPQRGGADQDPGTQASDSPHGKSGHAVSDTGSQKEPVII